MRYVMSGSIAALFALGGASHAADPRAAELTFQPWTKFCLTQSNCYLNISANGKCTPSGGAISLSLQNGNRGILTANYGMKTLLEGPISLRIDQDTPLKIEKPHCYASGCGGTIEADGAMIERLKRAQTVTMEATSMAGEKLSISFPLTDFAKAYDGSGRPLPKTTEQALAELRETKKDPPLPACED